MFLHGQGQINSDSELGIKLVKQSALNSAARDFPMIGEYLKKARTLGSMCGKNNSAISIMAVLGVQL
ncbi:hypothetical protein NBRC116583_34360 [Arenicella sp. 4NH20-0111]